MRSRGHIVPSVAAIIIAVSILLGFMFSAYFEGSQIADQDTALPNSFTNDDVRFPEIFAYGVHMLAVDRHDDAAVAFEQAIQLRPGQPEAHVNLGYARLMAGNYSAAAQSFRTAIDIRPGQVNAYYGLAESLEALGDFESAMGAMRAFIHLSDDSNPFRRRARSAMWEWSDQLSRQQSSSNKVDRNIAGDFLPDIIEGNGEFFPEYSGRVKIVNVWATWCPPCRAELPSLQALSERLDPRKFAVIGVSVDDDRDFVREFLKEMKVAYPNYMDTDANFRSQFEVDSYPQTLILRPDGALAERIIGVRNWSHPDVLDGISRLVSSTD